MNRIPYASDDFPRSEEERVGACIRAPWGSHLLREDSLLIERPGWAQILTPSCADTSLNEVVFSETETKAAAQVVEQTMQEYAGHGVPFKWCVGPWTQPSGFSDLLRNYGFQGWRVRGMGAVTHSPFRASSAEISVRRVNDARLPAFLAVYAEGWGIRERETAAIEDAIRKARSRTLPKMEFFLALVHQTPAGVSSYCMQSGGVAYLNGAVVLPEFRGRGLYHAMIAARFRSLLAQRVGYAVTQAREATSAPILEKMGFTDLFHSCCFQAPTH